MRYGIRITDFHSHVLPGADHGSDSVETSERQLELLNGAGIDRVVATPHFYPSDVTVGEFLDLREQILYSCFHDVRNCYCFASAREFRLSRNFFSLAAPILRYLFHWASFITLLRAW